MGLCNLSSSIKNRYLFEGTYLVRYLYRECNLNCVNKEINN